MKIKNFLFAATFLAAVLTGCSDNDSPEPTPNPEPELEANLSLSLVNPTVSTYATDPNARDEEMTITAAQVFVYQNGALAVYRELEGSKFANIPVSQSQNLWTYSESIPIPTGDGIIVYVAVNLPSYITTAIRSNGYESAVHEAYDVTAAGLSADNNFVMFSGANDMGTVVKDQVTSVAAVVERLTSKISVLTDPQVNYKVAGGTIQPDIKFTVKQLNTKSYLVKRMDNAGIVTDPNYTDNAAYDGQFADNNNYVSVVAKGSAANKDLPVIYAPENTVDHQNENQITYALVKTIFIPDTIVDGNGNFKEEPSAPVTFYTVYKDASNPDQGIYYFNDYDEALAFAGGDASLVSDPYVNGENNYVIYMIDIDGVAPNLFGVVRNDFYQANIKTFSGLGNPGEGPEPPVERTNMDVQIEIVHWNVVESEHDL